MQTFLDSKHLADEKMLDTYYHPEVPLPEEHDRQLYDNGNSNPTMEDYSPEENFT